MISICAMVLIIHECIILMCHTASAQAKYYFCYFNNKIL